MANVLGTDSNFKSLSLRDLLEARDLYHYHLMNKANVVGTAVGLYLIRHSDPEPDDVQVRLGRKRNPEKLKWTPRTLENSGIRDYSWPCVHAFVSEWANPEEFRGGRKKLKPEDIVPKTLYLPDGRMIPVCVTLVKQGVAKHTDPIFQWPGGLYGGGQPIQIETQQRRHTATAGCLVTDGHTTYALTNRHVSGDKREPVYVNAHGRMVEIGCGSERVLSRLPFTDVYPEFKGHRTYVNLDVGLIELNDVNEWTSRYLELDNSGPLGDLNELNISVRLINAPVVAVAAASGRIEGRIKALFYRFKSVGGYDYVSDFLIAPRALGSPDKARAAWTQTRPGDSGAVWHLITLPEDFTPRNEDEEFKTVKQGGKGILRPLAVQWGGQVFMEGGASNCYTFALATNLTTVCRELNVELVAQHNISANNYWGQLGHYSIGSFACLAMKQGKLKTFFNENIDQISFSIDELTPGAIKAQVKAAKEGSEMIRLSDVPDLLWKSHKSKVTGGRDTRWAGAGRSNGPEHPTHYADIDEPRSDGKTLRDLSLADPENNITVEFWQKFYDEVGHTEEGNRGLLPFRVWQFFDAMVDAVKKKQMDRYICAAGLLSHYVGDACQALHGSMYADGYKDQVVTTTHHKRDTGEEYTKKSNKGAGVHSAYETKMVDRHAEEIVEGVRSAITKAGPKIGTINNGQDAAIEVVKLMARTAKECPPTEIVDAYIDAGGKPNVATQDALWEQFGDATIRTMADGSRVLARIWEAAWKKGSGSQVPASKMKRIPEQDLIDLYEDTGFVPSLNLDDVKDVLKG